jgi:hypothetical protein
MQSEGRLPADWKQIEAQVAENLETMKKQGQPISDPRNWPVAIDTAIRAVRSAKAAEKARRASRSISGSPSPGAEHSSGRSGSSWRGNEDEIWRDAAAAVRAANV